MGSTAVAERTSTEQVADAVGLTYRQLNWLVKEHVITPAIYAQGSGSRWRWSAEQIRTLRLLSTLRDLGASIEVLRRLRPVIEDLSEQAWSTRVLLTPDGRVTTLLGADRVGYLVDLAWCRSAVECALIVAA